jgi:hypothetical protein
MTSTKLFLHLRLLAMGLFGLAALDASAEESPSTERPCGDDYQTLRDLT